MARTSRSVWASGLLFILSLALLTGCGSDSNGPAPSDLEGTYTFDRFEFVTDGIAVANFDILADTLVTSDRSPRMEFFGGNATVNLVYRVEGSDGSSQLSGRFSTSSGAVTADFSEEPVEERREILLPEIIRFEIVNGGLQLRADQPRSEVDLGGYAPGRFGELTTGGKLVLRMGRIAETPAAVWYDAHQ